MSNLFWLSGSVLHIILWEPSRGPSQINCTFLCSSTVMGVHFTPKPIGLTEVLSWSLKLQWLLREDKEQGGREIHHHENTIWTLWAGGRYYSSPAGSRCQCQWHLSLESLRHTLSRWGALPVLRVYSHRSFLSQACGTGGGRKHMWQVPEQHHGHYLEGNSPPSLAREHRKGLWRSGWCCCLHPFPRTICALSEPTWNHFLI